MTPMASPPDAATDGLTVYLVGGHVRDRLMGGQGTSVGGDRDWVVVGATVDAMLARGFVPVGKDFPVFLHPLTHEEYALARTERKTASGYRGFAVHASPDVTLEEDLARRDLTVNAIAEGPDGQLIDPFCGVRDLADGILRHVSPAFVEDPVRILRLARFAARWPTFRIDDNTMDLCRAMVARGEVDALVAERVWQELSQALMARQPSRALQVLRSCGALQRLLPEVDALYGVPQRADYHPEIDTGIHVEMVIDQAARLNLNLPARFAALTHDLGKATTPAEILPRHVGHEGRSVQLIRPLCDRLRVPTDTRELALLVAAEHGNIHASLNFSPEATIRVLERCDAWRRPERFVDALGACEADARGRLGLEHLPYPQAERLRQALARTQSLDNAAIIREAQAQGLKGPALSAALAQARVAAWTEHN
jgi:tRNA nucleotidyltransferase (CCA-adding enzyme)